MCEGCDAEDDDNYDVPHHPTCLTHKPTLRLGTTGLCDEHIAVCKWCQQDIRKYIEVKAGACKWLYEQCKDLSIVGLIVHFIGHRLAFEQTSRLHRHSRWGRIHVQLVIVCSKSKRGIDMSRVHQRRKIIVMLVLCMSKVVVLGKRRVSQQRLRTIRRATRSSTWRSSILRFRGYSAAVGMQVANLH